MFRRVLFRSPEDLSLEGYPLELLGQADRIACAWGAHPWAPARARKVLAGLRPEVELLCLDTTKDGWPCHPLYLPGRLTLRAWGVPG